jgi:hypothetical protein
MPVLGSQDRAWPIRNAVEEMTIVDRSIQAHERALVLTAGRPRARTGRAHPGTCPHTRPELRRLQTGIELVICLSFA